MNQVPFFAMGSRMLAILDDDGADTQALASVPAWFEEWERTLSRFQPESELERCNWAAGMHWLASDVLLEATQAALRSAEETDGLVHPLMLDAMRAAGYDRTFEALREDKRPIARTSVPDWRLVVVDSNQGTIRLPLGGHLDLGGSAKGWAADRAMMRLAEDGPALVDAGGDIAVSGLRADGSPWPIAVENPFDADRSLGTLAVCGGGVATSGRDYHTWKRGGQWQHHILDPRTGLPARTDVFAATVVAPTAREAEAAAKAALILGSRDGMRWIEAQEHLAAIFVLEDGRVEWNERMRQMLWEEMVV
jgi:FAD:protein FMN transferase